MSFSALLKMAPRRFSRILGFADDVATAATVDKLLGFETHKTHTEKLELKTIREKRIFAKQMEIYKNSIADLSYKYTKNNSFKDHQNDVKIVATRNIEIGQIINTLCGQTAIIKPEDIKEGVNDFSIMHSSKNGKSLLFLGPAAYINHACSPNTKWESKGKSIWSAKTIKAIIAGEEIMADYGKNFFSINNVDCECECCNNKKKAAKETDTHELHEDSDSTSDETEEDELSSISDTEKYPLPQYPCTVCSKSFKYLSSMQRHLQTHNKNKVECTFCHKLLSSQESLKRHMSVHQKKRKRKHKCQACGSKYYQHSDLLYHIKNIHEKKRKGQMHSM